METKAFYDNFLIKTLVKCMKIAGVEFAPLLVPLHRRIETLAAATWFITMAFGGFIGLFLSAYLILCTRFWLPTLLYCAWCYYDRGICDVGGRPSTWVRSWSWWNYCHSYLPANLVAAPGCRLDPARNYLWACFPHGILPTGVSCAVVPTASNYRTLFPDHFPHIVTLTQHYYMPFFRDLALALGGIAASSKAIGHVLTRPNGGHVVALMPGGAAEAYYCKPGQYKILLGKRKGFVKLALRCGSPLVPVISFGETDLYGQLDGVRLRKFQEQVRKYIGVAPVIPNGRGFFQYTFGIIPRRRAVTTVVGKPIDVEKTENPTNEQIDELHKKFTEAIITLFEEEKSKYIENSEQVTLEI